MNVCKELHKVLGAVPLVAGAVAKGTKNEGLMWGRRRGAVLYWGAMMLHHIMVRAKAAFGSSRGGKRLELHRKAAAIRYV